MPHVEEGTWLTALRLPIQQQPTKLCLGLCIFVCLLVYCEFVYLIVLIVLID